jgi:hypothetical protein
MTRTGTPPETRPTGYLQVKERAQGRVWYALWRDADGRHRKPGTIARGEPQRQPLAGSRSRWSDGHGGHHLGTVPSAAPHTRSA